MDVRDQQQKEELLELVSEAREEIDKPKANSIRLASVLGGIGQAVQTIGSATAAYQAVKAVASLLGLQLP